MKQPVSIFARFNALGVCAGAASVGRPFDNDNAPCPRCGAERQHPKRNDPRPALTAVSGGFVARCWACDTSFNAVDYASLALTGRRFKELAGSDKQRVAQLIESFLSGDHEVDLFDLPTPEPVAPKPYAKPSEIRMFHSFGEGHKDPSLGIGYLVGRGIPRQPTEFYRKELAIGFPNGNATLKLYDHEGHARNAVKRLTRSRGPKSITMTGKKSGGLVLANRLGHGWLTGTSVPILYTVEGELDLVAFTTVYPTLPAIGVRSGSITDNYSSAFERASEVHVFTHPDSAGDAYAARIEEVAGKHKCKRRLRTEDDLSDELRVTGAISLKVQ